MSLVHHDGAVILVLQLDNLWQVGQVALHREDAIDNDQLDSLMRQGLEYALKVLHIIVLIVQLGCKRKTAAVYDTGVVAVIADDIVIAAYHTSQHALVDRETCREAQGLILVHELGQLLLELYVKVEGSIEETASCTTRTILVESSLGCIDNTLVVGQTLISIRTEHQNLMSVDVGNFRHLLTGDLTEVWVHTGSHILLRFTIILVFFL